MYERYTEGYWVKYRSHEGFTAEGKILEERPDGKYVIGQHDQDPDPDIVKESDIVGEL